MCFLASHRRIVATCRFLSVALRNSLILLVFYLRRICATCDGTCDETFLFVASVATRVFFVAYILPHYVIAVTSVLSGVLAITSTVVMCVVCFSRCGAHLATDATMLRRFVARSVATCGGSLHSYSGCMCLKIRQCQTVRGCPKTLDIRRG